MLNTPIHVRDVPLFSDDLDRISSVFDGICRDKGIDRKTQEAEDLGAMIIELYRQGVKDGPKLAALALACL